VHGVFEKQVAKTPDHIAIIHNGKRYTYHELNVKANQLAEILRQKGVGADDPVAIVLERSSALIVAMFGVMKAGGAYIPIDHECSVDRISYILQDSQAKILITQKNLAGRSGFQGTVIDLDEVEFHTGLTPNLPWMNSPENLVYIIYTSGSTGNPKGVMVEHRNLLTYLKAFQNEFQLTPNDVILQQAPCSFDHFVEELFPGLVSGGTIVIADKMDVLDLKKLVTLVKQNQISLITCQPLLLNELNKAPRLEKVHTYLSGADVLKAEHISNLLQRGRVYNTYGPTEATVCAAYYRCSLDDTSKSVPIGKPILNYRIDILSPEEQLMPVGIPGEICISGPGVARGYLNQPELTAEKFISVDSGQLTVDSQNLKSVNIQNQPKENGFNNCKLSTVDCQLYKTGDIGRWLPDGNLEFIGRDDEQVKIRGFRIEPGEIEYHLVRHAAIAEAVVLAREAPSGNPSLAAYVKPIYEVKAQELRDYLAARLPAYMIPSYFFKIDSVPMTANSKTDKQALAEYGIPLDVEVVHSERPLTAT
jgi:fengycin family lipopeptide synthetase D